MLTPNQKKILNAFKRTGIATQKDLKAQSPHWRTSLAKLITLGIVETIGECYCLTQKGTTYMGEIDE